MNAFEYVKFLDLNHTLEDFSEHFWKTFGRLSEDFLGSLLMHFMLEDIPRSLQKVFQSFMLKVVQILDMHCVFYILDSIKLLIQPNLIVLFII